ncbi:Hypothetical predicted protein [Octopus vulgaris]|uniref:Uncharacterized protein n=1 Tax=Octopus vulgaris TaxID=6645 RepID=A0AA36F168_OCTVU|nr:Hypothetical predicted protein [Octopus vulgaris]
MKDNSDNPTVPQQVCDICGRIRMSRAGRLDTASDMTKFVNEVICIHTGHTILSSKHLRVLGIVVTLVGPASQKTPEL